MARRPKADAAGLEVQQVLDVLETYKVDHPLAVVDAYRQNSAAIRVRIIAPDFRGMDRVERHDSIWEILEQLSEEVLSQISVLLLLTPEETVTSFANYDFENPIPSRL